MRKPWFVRFGVPLAAALVLSVPAGAVADEAPAPTVSAEPIASAATPSAEPASTSTSTSTPTGEPGPTTEPPPTTEPEPMPAAATEPAFTESGVSENSMADASPALTIVTTELPQAHYGRPYSAPLSAAGGAVGALVWSVTDGQLPKGLSLDTDGTVAGTPERVGTYSASIAVLDSAAATVTRTLTLVVRAALDAVVSEVASDLVRYSYRAGCPVKPSSLRLIEMNYWGFDDRPHRGRLIVRSNVVDDITDVFDKAFEDKFPIHRMNLMEHYKGSDKKAMKADNTSAFNCRHVTGNPTRLSQHSYGNALDINSVENPYVTKGHVYPAKGKKYLKRSRNHPGMIHKKDAIARAFAHEHWKWGARWSRPDYQHFSSNGG